jgi:Tfp pilus assembly protein PilN
MYIYMTTNPAAKPLVQIDLLPQSYRAHAQGRVRLRSLSALVIITLAVYAVANLVLVVLSSSVSGAVQDRREIEREILAFEKKLKEKKGMLAARQKARASFAEQNAEREVIPTLLSALGVSTPPTITLRHVALSPQGVDISGVAQDSEAVRRWMVQVSKVCSELETTLRQLQRVEIGQAVVQEFTAHLSRKKVTRAGLACDIGGS